MRCYQPPLLVLFIGCLMIGCSSAARRYSIGVSHDRPDEVWVEEFRFGGQTWPVGILSRGYWAESVVGLHPISKEFYLRWRNAEAVSHEARISVPPTVKEDFDGTIWVRLLPHDELLVTPVNREDDHWPRDGPAVWGEKWRRQAPE